MRAFVTGGTGTLGRWVIRLLNESGYQVRALCRSQMNRAVLKDLCAEPFDADLFTPATLKKAVEGCDSILHLATKIPLSSKFRSQSAWEQNDRIRREGTSLLVDVALALDVSTFIYPSVCFVYPESGAKWIDSENAKPVHGGTTTSTLDAEAHVARFGGSGRRGASLRMGAFYGPDSRQSWQQLKLAHWGIATIFGAERVFHSSIWIEDAARAVVAALQGVPSGIYDVVDDEPLQNQETLAVLAKNVGRRKLFQVPNSVLRWSVGSEIMKIVGRSQRVSNKRFKETTGWSPKVISAREGWSLMVNYAKE